MWDRNLARRVEKLLLSIDERREKSLLKFMNPTATLFADILPHILRRNINIFHEVNSLDASEVKLFRLVKFWPVSTSEIDSNVCISSLNNALKSEDFSVDTSDGFKVLIGWLELGKVIRKRGDKAPGKVAKIYDELVRRILVNSSDFETSIIVSAASLAEEESGGKNAN